MEVELSGVDVDGIIVIGDLPLVRWLDKGSIDLNDMQLTPIKGKLRSASDEDKRIYDDRYTLYIGTSGGMPYHLVTSLPPTDLQQLLMQYVARSTVGDLGFVNGWMAIGTGNVASLREKMALGNCSKLQVTTKFLDNFSNWLHRQRPDDEPAVLGGIFWFGMRYAVRDFLPMFQQCVSIESIRTSHIHLAVELKSRSRYPSIVTLNALLKKEFHSSKGDTQWYHPIGIIDGVNCTSKHPSPLVRYHEQQMTRNITSIRMYQPELMHCRTPELRMQRAACAVAAMVGGPKVVRGAYASHCRNAQQWVDCIESGLYGVVRHGSVLRVEFVMPFDGLSPAEILKLRKTVRDFLIEKQRLIVVPTDAIPYDTWISPAIDIIRTAGAHRFRQVVAAEAYLGLLIDGGTLRIYYPGLKAALGQTIGNALKAVVGGDSVIITPVSPTFDYVKWEDLYFRQLKVPLAYYLKISEETALRMLDYMQARYPSNVPVSDRRHGRFWIGMVKLLLSIEAGCEEGNCWTVEYHQRKGQLYSAISPHSLANVLVHTRRAESHNKLRALACTFVRSYLDTSFPNEYEDAKIHTLEGLIEENLSVFPHSLPVYKRDRIERWWRVGQDPDQTLLEVTLHWMSDNLPRTLERIPILARVTTDSPLLGHGWYLVNRFLESGDNSDFNTIEKKQFFRAIFVLIMATAMEQQRLNKPSYHPFLPWGEWRVTMRQHLDQIFTKIQTWNLLSTPEAGTPDRETFFCIWQVAGGMPGRLDELENIFVTRHILVAAPLVPQGAGDAGNEIPPDHDGALAPDQDDGIVVEPQMVRHRIHADVRIMLQDDLSTTRRRTANHTRAE